jgi:hypothetical protein
MLIGPALAVSMTRQVGEASAVLMCRAALGDEQTADLLFSQDYDAGFCGRHTHQLGGLLIAKMNAETTDSDT